MPMNAIVITDVFIAIINLKQIFTTKTIAHEKVFTLIYFIYCPCGCLL
mgnify:CR=1 FL=1